MFRQPVAHAGRSRPFARVLILAGLVGAWPVASRAQTVERLSDKEVKTLIEQVDEARDKFEGNLDNDLKRSTIRTATREISVSAALQDLQDNVGKLKDRFTPDYAASAEAEIVLKQGTNIANYMKTATLSKGRSEWEKFSATLTSLSNAYGTSFPLMDGATVRRINDKEAAGAADALARAADQFKDKIDEHDGKLSAADESAGKKTADDLVKAAKALKSRLDDSKPSTAEAKQVVQLATSLASFNNAHRVPAAQAAYTSVLDAMTKLQQAFSMIQTPR